MKSQDRNASNASQQGKPIGFSRRQLLAGTPLAAFGVAVSGLNLGNVTSSVAAELTEKKNSVEAPVDPSRGLVRHSSGTKDEGGRLTKAESKGVSGNQPKRRLLDDAARRLCSRRL